jgi:hypothetical protein
MTLHLDCSRYERDSTLILFPWVYTCTEIMHKQFLHHNEKLGPCQHFQLVTRK